MVISRFKTAGNYRHAPLNCLFLGNSFSASKLNNATKLSTLPLLGEAVDDGGSFVAGEAQADKPFFV